MSFYADESAYLDYDEASADAAEVDAHHQALLTEYADAHAALRTLTPAMDRTTRWMILDRVVQAAQALEVERDREHYYATNARIQREICGAL